MDVRFRAARTCQNLNLCIVRVWRQLSPFATTSTTKSCISRLELDLTFVKPSYIDKMEFQCVCVTRYCAESHNLMIEAGQNPYVPRRKDTAVATPVYKQLYMFSSIALSWSNFLRDTTSWMYKMKLGMSAFGSKWKVFWEWSDGHGCLVVW